MKKIQLNHIGKMEGHADFVAEILKGDVKSAKLITTEGSRLIEGILIGRHFSQAPIITSRICGICPVVHKLCSIKAIERAFGVKPGIQTEKLRRLLNLAQIIHSHGLHIFFLSLADFFDLENDLVFFKKYPKETNQAIAVRNWALKLIEIIGGRAVHPIACEIGGFKTLPEKDQLKNLLSHQPLALKNALGLANFTIKIKYPRFTRPTRFVSLTAENRYAFYNGDLKFSADPNRRGKTVKTKDFTKNIKEIEEPYRAAKSAVLDGEPFMVGALARINNNRRRLNPLAAGLLKGLNWKFPQQNTFENITAQAIEIVHCLEEAKGILEDILKNFSPDKSRGQESELSVNPRGRGTSGIDAIEAPRGTLYHQYTINKNGEIVDCDIITPTVCFLKNLEEDLKELIPDLAKISPKKRTRRIRALIRAYDPCIACATH